MSAATDLQILIDARTAVLQAIRDSAGKPDYSIGGQSVTWSSLTDRLATINEQITALGGPVELVSEGI